MMFENESPMGVRSKLQFSCKHVFEIWHFFLQTPSFNYCCHWSLYQLHTSAVVAVVVVVVVVVVAEVVVE